MKTGKGEQAVNEHLRNNTQISPYQLVALLFCGRLAVSLMLSSTMTQSDSPADFIFSLMVSGVGTAVLLFPAWVSEKRRGAGDRLIAGRGVYGVYAAICLVAVVIDLTRFWRFVDATLTERLPRFWLCLLFVAVAAASALYGLEALARCAFLIALLLGGVLILSAVFLFPVMRVDAFPPLLAQGVLPVGRGALEELPRSLELAILPILLPYVSRGGIRAGLRWCGWQTLGAVGGQTLATGVLGSYMHSAPIPYYEAVTMLTVGALSRLDAAVAVMLAASLFVRVALFFWLFSQCCLVVFSRARRVQPMAIGAAVALAGTVLLTSVFALQNEASILWITSVALIVLGGIILPILLALRSFQHRSSFGKSEGVKV